MSKELKESKWDVLARSPASEYLVGQFWRKRSALLWLAVDIPSHQSHSSVSCPIFVYCSHKFRIAPSGSDFIL